MAASFSTAFPYAPGSFSSEMAKMSAWMSIHSRSVRPPMLKGVSQ